MTWYVDTFSRVVRILDKGEMRSHVHLQQTAYVNFYNVTKFPLYTSFSVPCEQRPFDLPRKIEGPLFASSKSLRRAYYPPPDCLRCDWQGDKKVSLRFPKLLSYPILSPFPFFPTLSYSFSTLCYHALLTLPFPTRSYPTPSHPIPSNPIPSTYCILNFSLGTCHQVFLHFCRICCIFSS